MSLLTLEEAKAQLAISSNGNDQEIERYIDGIVPSIENYTGEITEEREVTEDIDLYRSSRFVLTWAPVQSLTSVQSIDGVDVAVDTLHVTTNTGEVRVIGSVRMSGMFMVTYQAGYNDAPANYRQAAVLIVQHLWDTRRGSSGTIPGQVIGSEETYDPRFSYSVPRRALELLGAPTPGVH